MHTAHDYKSNLKILLRRARRLWTHPWANWGPQPLGGARQFVPPGHFYSPIPALDDIRANERSIFGRMFEIISGIEFYEDKQLHLLHQFKKYYDDLPFAPYKKMGLRYFFENPSYSYSDAIFLYCMIRHLQPKRVVEIGSGFSSCVMLDTNELYFNGAIETTFIDPHPNLLLSLIHSQDRNKINIVDSHAQNVDLEKFDSLEANDILFVDSTHVSKIDSDVNRLFFEILPRIREGVFIHFHDIFYPFEYPKEWIYEGRAWNEAYLLRAFLQYNTSFRIVLMNTFLEHFHKEFFEREMPLCLRNPGGSIWIRKTSGFS